MPTTDPVILYCSFTGALQPLGYAQVVQPLLSLSKQGLRYHLVSLEREQDLADAKHLDRTKAELARAGIGWSHSVYRADGGLPSIASNMSRFLIETFKVAKQEEIVLVHARAYLGAMIALALKRARGIPYLFDTRSFWFDELREEGRRFLDPISSGMAHSLERTLFEECAGAVCLAEPGAKAILAGEYGRWEASKPFRVIPTCVNYSLFASPGPDRVPAEHAERLRGKLVIGYIGSLNRSYKVEASLDLFRRILQQRDDAILLGLTRQQEALSDAARAHGIPPESMLITSGHHYEMPSWLSHIDWGMLLLKTSRAKRASMPTKLAEFFAAGVRPIQHGCNPSVSRWVASSGAGLVLDDLSSETLEHAAEHIARGPKRDEPAALETLDTAREHTRGHFSLEAGAIAYRELIEEIFANPAQ